jgi:hypothetical protein
MKITFTPRGILWAVWIKALFQGSSWRRSSGVDPNPQPALSFVELKCLRLEAVGCRRPQSGD